MLYSQEYLNWDFFYLANPNLIMYNSLLSCIINETAISLQIFPITTHNKIDAIITVYCIKICITHIIQNLILIIINYAHLLNYYLFHLLGINYSVKVCYDWVKYMKL